MPAIPIGRSIYRRTEAPQLRLVNMFFEALPTSLEDQVSLRPRPRHKQFSMCGAGPIKGLYRKGGVLASVGLSGSIIALSLNQLFRVTQAGVPGVGTATLIGTMDGTFRMSAEGNSSVVVVTCGQTSYTTNGTTLTPIAFPDGNIVSAVDYLNGYFLFASAFGRFYWSAVGGTTVAALDYATAESQPDELLTLKVIGDELWLFGRYSIEVWQPTGVANLPFQRISGRIFGIGVTSRETVQKLSLDGIDTVCWVGTDRRVYRTDPNPRRISDHSMEERLKRATLTTPASDQNPYATVENWDGHDFYVLNIPGDGSFAYDLSTDTWHEMTSYGLSLYRANVWAVGPNNQPLIGDTQNGTIWELSVDSRFDGADPVTFEWSGLLDVPTVPVRCNNVTLDVATGYAASPEDEPDVEMCFSEDMGETWSDFEPAPLGRQGERGIVPLWTRQGQLRRPGRVFRWRTTEPVVVRKAKYNESLR